jgi:hypothetical protein
MGAYGNHLLSSRRKFASQHIPTQSSSTIQAGRQDDVRGCATTLLQQPPAKMRQRGPGAPLRD